MSPQRWQGSIGTPFNLRRACTQSMREDNKKVFVISRLPCLQDAAATGVDFRQAVLALQELARCLERWPPRRDVASAARGLSRRDERIEIFEGRHWGRSGCATHGERADAQACDGSAAGTLLPPLSGTLAAAARQ
eukprot:5854224-Pleurochrysis_carterae.AAC.2